MIDAMLEAAAPSLILVDDDPAFCEVLGDALARLRAQDRDEDCRAHGLCQHYHGRRLHLESFLAVAVFSPRDMTHVAATRAI